MDQQAIVAAARSVTALIFLAGVVAGIVCHRVRGTALQAPAEALAMCLVALFFFSLCALISATDMR